MVYVGKKIAALSAAVRSMTNSARTESADKKVTFCGCKNGVHCPP
jgi:hypothetical protein